MGPLPWAAWVARFRARREGAQAQGGTRAEEGCRAAGRSSDGAAAGVALIQATRGSGGCCGAAWWSPGGAAAGVALIQATRGSGGCCGAAWWSPGGAAAGGALNWATREGVGGGCRAIWGRPGGAAAGEATKGRPEAGHSPPPNLREEVRRCPHPATRRLRAAPGVDEVHEVLGCAVRVGRVGE